MTTFVSAHPPKADVLGAYSLWPRRARYSRRTAALLLTATAAVAFFAHCVLPMITGA